MGGKITYLLFCFGKEKLDNFNRCCLVFMYVIWPKIRMAGYTGNARGHTQEGEVLQQARVQPSQLGVRHMQVAQT